MTVQMRGTTFPAFGSTAQVNVTPGLPTVQAGDLVVALLVVTDDLEQNEVEVTGPAGWTRVSSALTGFQNGVRYTPGAAAVFTRLYQAGDANPTFTYSRGGHWRLALLSYYDDSGAKPVTLVTSGFSTQLVSSGSAGTFPAVTAKNGSRVVRAITWTGGNTLYTTPSGTTDLTNGSSFDRVSSGVFAGNALSSGGGTGAASTTSDTGTPFRMNLVTLAVEPAPSLTPYVPAVML